jgi:hypothetical protein
MENDDKDEKKSHKKVKQTIGQVILATRKAKKAVAPPKRNRVSFYSNSTRPSSGPAGNIQKTNNKKQKNEGVVVNDRNNLGFARAGFLTPTKTATDANKAARGNFAGRTNKTNEPEKRMAVAAIDNSSRKRGKKEIGAQKMDGAPTELVPVHGINTRRLLLEDFVVLQPGTTVWILVRKDHVTFRILSNIISFSMKNFGLKNRPCITYICASSTHTILSSFTWIMRDNCLVQDSLLIRCGDENNSKVFSDGNLSRT